MNKNEEYTGSEIAVIGMSCRFPEASTPEAFWQNICDGKESRTIFSREELLESKVPQILIDDPEYVPSRGVIHDIDKFDAEFFKYTPMEASIIDPQQRIFLQIAWEALETAGYDPTGSKPVTGLFAGVASSSYLNTQLAQLAASNDPSKNYQINMGNDKDFLATRVAYKLDLQGPVMTVQTACSTSLVASHQACQSLLNGECDMALAGGVTLIIPQKQGYLYQEGMILSPDGQCRPFDSEGNGTIIGNGAGVVVLRRLEDAIEDNDPIMAVIRGSAVNNDGSKKIGYTAPGSFGQTAVIRESLICIRS
jgi:Polyketide synthase modules and related proteins